MKPLALLAVLALLDSCVGADPRAVEDAGRSPAIDAATFDGGHSRRDDGGPALFVDASSVPDTGVPPELDTEFDDADNFSGVVAACSDRLDNNGDGAADCADTSCQARVASCCVGSDSVVCCGEPSPVALDVSGCTGRLDTCLAREGIVALGGGSAVARELDGAHRIFIEERGSDHGVTLDEALDPRAGVVRIEATIQAPVSSDAEIDAMGVALIDPAIAPEDVARVTPIAGFLVSRNRQQVSFLLAGESVQSWAIDDGDDHRYALTIEPDGGVTFQVDDEPVERATLDWRAPVRAVLYGRGGAGAGAVSAGRVAVGVSACDMPDALVRDPGLTIPSRPAWAESDSLREPSVAQAGSRVRMALRVGPDIHLAEPDGLGGFRILGGGAPVLGETEAPWGNGGVADPALQANAGGALELYFTGFDDAGNPSIGRVVESADDTFDVANAAQLLGPDTDGAIAGFSSPAPFVYAGQPHVAVVEHRLDGSRPIAVWNLAAAPRRVSEVRRPHPDDLFAFDRDEVAAPSVITIGDVVRLYFGGRRGSRWTVGVMVSDELLEWRSPDSDQVLGATERGFDALGARDPAAYRAGDVLRLYYAGTDGSRTDLGSASGPIR